MECLNCGGKVDSNAHFCPLCGHAIIPEKELTKRIIHSPWLKILLTASFLGLLFYILMSYSTSDLFDPVEKQLTALKTNNFQEAYYDYTSKDFQTNNSFENFKKTFSNHPILHKFTILKLGNVTENNNYGSLKAVLQAPSKEGAEILFNLIKEGETWKILSIQFKEIQNEPPQNTSKEKEITSLDSVGMMEVVKKHLEAIKRNEIESAYYDFIAKDLQKETPLAQFRDFISSYPAFSSYTTFNITEPNVEEGIGRLSVELFDERGTTVVEYALGEVEGKWKILGVHVERNPQNLENKDGSSFKMRDLMEVIKNFLSFLKSKELEKAYQLTSKLFQEENSFPAFKDFITNHPELAKSQASTFEKLIFNNSIATLTGDINDGNNALPLEFDLIKENNKWKILHIITHPAVEINKKVSQEVKGPKVEFTKIILGDKIDDTGKIVEPKTAFSPAVGDIYSNLYIQNGVKGQTFEVDLRHVESGTAIPTVKGVLDEGDEAIISLIFSPPPKGWPKGNYQITARSKESSKTFTFRVE